MAEARVARTGRACYRMREETTEAKIVLPNDWRQRRRSQFMTTLERGDSICFLSNTG